MVPNDGTSAVIDVVNACQQPPTIIAVGPVPILAEALRRDPSIAAKAKFVGMVGAVGKGYGGSDKVGTKPSQEACGAVIPVIGIQEMGSSARK